MNAPARLTPPFGPVSRRPLDLRDAQLRRCRFCGSWCWAADACTACGTTADRQEAVA